MDYMSYESIQFYSKMVHSCLCSIIYFNPLITDSATIMLFIYYFASAAVAVDSSQTTVSSSASWVDSVRLQILLMGTCHNVVHGLSLATTTERRLGETPFVQVSTTWALTCPETVRQRPRMIREIKTCHLMTTLKPKESKHARHRRLRPTMAQWHQQLNLSQVWRLSKVAANSGFRTSKDIPNKDYDTQHSKCVTRLS